MASPADSIKEAQDLEWEEWDGNSSFLHHCLAGSIAGIAEHTLMYPVDTVKTHMQSYCADCPAVKSGPVASAGTAASRALSGSASVSVGPPGNVPGHVPLANPPQQQHGMWRTMANIVTYGHPNYNASLYQYEPRIGSSSLALDTASKQLASAAQTMMADGTVKQPLSAANNTRVSVMHLWRGVQAVIVGCAPAHALYFSMYEAVKAAFLAAAADTDSSPLADGRAAHLSTIGSAAAGAAATACHDLVMTPLDTIKQRLQLGHYRGMRDAARSIVKYEGYAGLYRSFPITLATNMPYGIIMVSANEFFKNYLNPGGKFDVKTYMLAGSGAGILASALTTPLDRIKTRLQIQTLGSTVTSLPEGALACESLPSGKCGKAQVDVIIGGMRGVKYSGFSDAMQSIIKEEGVAGLFRGITPRVLSQAPAVAISWTTYESAKKWLHFALAEDRA